ncbi:F-box only protein 47-like [Liolophura sinensis]|uniref:F-box only protein 47-like n=1 Tax=Liolophura sinensis TaxID=3198878 RepID=UPI0031594B57
MRRHQFLFVQGKVKSTYTDTDKHRRTMITIKSFLRCKKLRRSNRLEKIEKEEIREKVIQDGPLGYFDILPIELKYHILGYFSVKDLSILTITSKMMRNLVEGYRGTSHFSRHLLPQPLPHKSVPVDKQADYIRNFEKLGLLLKRSTCLYATKDRLKFIIDFLNKMSCSYTKDCEDISKCIALTCFGKFLHTVLAGWDEAECIRAFDCICFHVNMQRTLTSILTGKPGANLKVEYDIRIFFRRVFLNQCESVQDRGFWLTRILKPFPLVHQARLLFILYGPVVEEEISWYEMCDTSPTGSEQTSYYFKDLANTIQILHCKTQEWSEDDIISVMDELSCIPEEWLPENYANLMLLCGDTITTKTLISKAINGRVLELSSIIASLCGVCSKNGFSQDYVISLTQKILEIMDSAKERVHLITSITENFKELLIDLHDFSSQDDRQHEEFLYMVSAVTQLTKKALHFAFKDMLSS